MPLDWYQLSRRNMGLILLNKKHPSSYLPDDFSPPFDEILDYMLDSPEWSPESVHQKFSCTDELQAATRDVKALNGAGDSVDWASELKIESYWHNLGSDLERIGHSAKKGERPDLLPVVSKMRSVSVNEKGGLQRADEVDWKSAKGLQKSGWKAIDTTFGGIPESGPLVVYGTTGTGKSFWTNQLLNKFLHYYKDKTAAAFSLEMSEKRYLKRGFEMYPSLEEVSDRLYVSGKARGIDEIVSDVSTTREVSIVVIDSIDYLVKQIDASNFERTWKSIVELGRLLEIPVVVTAQPNRVAKYNAMNRFIQKYDIAWSGAAEDSAEQLIGLQVVEGHNAREMEFEKTDEFPVFPNEDKVYYMICWKQREGWPVLKGPGAVILKDSGEKLWEGEAHKDKLWRPGEASRTVGGSPSGTSRRRRRTEE